MKKSYMNPYLAGVLLGVVLLLAMYLSGRGLGASGGIKYCAVSLVELISPRHAAESPYISRYFQGSSLPLLDWLPFEVFGMFFGAFLSGALSRRLKCTIEKSPRRSSNRRLVRAFAGGILFVYGAQLARGCTSGAALSGMAVLSVAGFVTMASIFGSAYLFAWFFRKNWI